MPRLGPLKRQKLIRLLRRLGFKGTNLEIRRY